MYDKYETPAAGGGRGFGNIVKRQADDPEDTQVQISWEAYRQARSACISAPSPIAYAIVRACFDRFVALFVGSEWRRSC